MKKSLFAIAAVTAFAGAAQAQSSVTVYGILDTGYVGSNSRTSNGSNVTVGNATAGKVYNSTGNQFTSSAQQTSRLGFKGNEDLGGGKAAFFILETTVAPASTTAMLGGTRQALVGLSQKGIGAASIGTQYTVIHTAVSATDVGQTNQMTGNVIYGAYTGPAGNNGSEAGSTENYTVRTGNMLKFASDSFAGFKVNATYTANNQNNNQTTTVTAGATTVTGGLNNQNGWGLGADYNWNKLVVTANYQAFTSKNAYTQTATGVPSVPVLWGSATGGSNVQDNQAYAAATYDFGILKAYLQYSNRKATSAWNSNYYGKRSAQQIGVRSFITPTIEAWASAGNGRFQSYGNAAPTANLAAFQLGSNYWLSKRTNLYAIYGQTGTSNVIPTNGSNAVSHNMNAYALGVRHTF